MKKHHVCPLSHAKSLESWLRKIIHNPKRILGKYLNPEMTVLDIGCGPGFFSVAIAEKVKKVIATDIQEGMLELLKKKGKKNIVTHKSAQDNIGVKEKVDFVLAFYIVHEVPNKDKFFKEIRSLMRPNSLLFIAEPKFHVSKDEWKAAIRNAAKHNLKVIKMPRILFSRAVVLKK